MENSEEQGMNYNKSVESTNSTPSSTSKNEAKLLSIIKENNLLVFKAENLSRVSGWSKRKIHNLLHSLEKKEAIVHIKRNAYVLKKEIAGRSFEIATETIKPSYISFWTALSHYGFTEQQVKPIQLVSTHQAREIEFNSQRIETTAFKSRKFYGYRRSEDGFAIAEPEKALIDSLHLPEKCGGLEEFTKCLKEGWSELDKERYLNYLLKFQSKSLNSRAGYLIEKLKLKGMNTEKLKKHKSKSYIKLNPSKEKKGKYNKKWRVIINSKPHEQVVE